MTAEDYRNAGFSVSNLIEQAAIDRAETDVIQAYVQPITGGNYTTDTVVKDAVMNLAFLLLLRRSTFATRAGAKGKTSANSYTPEQSAVMSECATTCAMKIKALRELTGVNATAKVNDICGIYFKSNYFKL